MTTVIPFRVVRNIITTYNTLLRNIVRKIYSILSSGVDRLLAGLSLSQHYRNPLIEIMYLIIAIVA